MDELGHLDYVVDAIDTVAQKLRLAQSHALGENSVSLSELALITLKVTLSCRIP